MEAIWKIDVDDFPAFIVNDNKGNDVYATLLENKPTPVLKIGGEQATHPLPQFAP